MATPAFCNSINKEQNRIKARCEEIDETMRALEDERKAFEERNEALEAVRDLYQTSQETLETALMTQARFSAAGSEAVAGDAPLVAN